MKKLNYPFSHEAVRELKVGRHGFNYRENFLPEEMLFINAFMTG